MNSGVAAVIRLLRFIGIFAIIYAWGIILTCVYINPWFIFTEHAFSDLGASTANNPWLYNYGMISIGILIILYSIYLIHVSKDKLVTIGSAYLLIAGIFLMLVGIYPAGTRPHVFVSTYFFLQFDLVIILWSLGAYKVNRDIITLSSLLIGLVAPIIGFSVPWPQLRLWRRLGYWLLIIG